MKHNHAHNSLLILAIAVFMLTIGLYVYMYMAVNSQTMRVVMAKDIQKVQRLDQKQIKDIEELFKHSTPAREKLVSLFVTKIDIVKFIEEIESMSISTGAKIDLTSVKETKEENTNMSKLTAHVEASGTWSQVIKTLIYIETMQKAITIDSVRVNTSGGEKDDKTKVGIWSLSLNITTNIIQ